MCSVYLAEQGRVSCSAELTPTKHAKRLNFHNGFAPNLVHKKELSSL